VGKKLAICVVWGLLFGVFVAVIQPSSADTVGRPDDGTPDEIYTGVVGPDYSETKSGGQGFAKLIAPSGLVAAGGEETAAAAAASVVPFPYANFQWTIYSWASTSDGLRFYGVYFQGRQIFFDFRTPWVGLSNVRYALNAARLVTGPDLLVYNSGMFLVKAKYNIGVPDVDVTVITRFYSNGNMEPWVLVDTKGVPKDIVVPERFDFDLQGSGDDNQQYYNGNAWTYTATESSNLDSANAENASGFQWRTFDTDQVGNGYIFAAEVDVTPYHPDGSRWYHLAYGAGEISGDPGGYTTGQTINAFNPIATDPWIGYDAVNWYVAYYGGCSIAYPGPWLKVKV
jgi:hypothetical protein